MDYIEIPLTKCKIFLTEKELVGLLSKDIDLYKEGLKRGKFFIRHIKQQIREEENFGKHEASLVNNNFHQN
jgi:hypothetical protein